MEYIDGIDTAFKKYIGPDSVEKLRSSINQKPMILIAGDQLTGKSTQAKNLSKYFSGTFHSVGNLFREVAAKRGITVAEQAKLLLTERGIDVEIDYKEMIITIISDDVWERGSAIGVAKRVCDDDIIIELKEGYWNQESVMRRFDLMYHELGHDALNLKHVCNRYDIMYTSNTEFNESCRENLNLIVPDSLDPQKYYGFKKASSRMFLGVNQVNFDCGADKTKYNIIVD